VLNAFRHQRGKQKISTWEFPVEFNECSTPFGIRGENRVILFFFPLVLLCAQRLSASEGKTGFMERFALIVDESAQRLSASEGKTDLHDAWN